MFTGVNKATLPDELHGFTNNDQVISTSLKTENTHSAYFLEMLAVIQGYHFTFPALYLPIEIQVPDMVLKPIQTPPDWQPQILSPVNLILTSNMKKKEVLECYDSKMAPTPYGMYGVYY